MSDIDDQIDRLYQGPLEAFTEQRNALAKAARRADLKTLAKPSVPAWAVNQLFWHRRPVLDRLIAAAEAVLTGHRRTLAGEPSDVRAAEQAHREAVRAALAAAREVLTSAGQAATPATLEAVRETLQALPSPEANGRLVRPLAPQGLEALAGLVLAARVSGPAAAPPPAPRRVAPAAAARTAGGTTEHVAEQARAAREKAKAAEKAAREREIARRKAEAALANARESLAAADAAVERAERDLATRQADRVAAREAVKRAQRLVEELSFGR